MSRVMKIKHRKYDRRKKSVRAKVKGTPERPRLSVHKSLSHVYVQIVDDIDGKTLAYMSTRSKQALEKFEDKDTKTEKGFKVGLLLAEIAKNNGIEKVVFDRQGNIYHGRVKAVADGARKGGLNF